MSGGGFGFDLAAGRPSPENSLSVEGSLPPDFSHSFLRSGIPVFPQPFEYLQDDPQEIPKLLSKIDEGYDIASGWRIRRGDNFLLRRLPSRITATPRLTL